MKQNGVIKKMLTLVLICAALFPALAESAQAADEISILVNNRIVTSDVPPYVTDGRTLVPVRAIAEAMGCDVIWVGSTQTVNLKNETTIVSMQIGNKTLTVRKINGDGKDIYIQTDVPPVIIQNRTFIPARAFCEALGAQVGWNGTSQTVIIVFDTDLKYMGNKTVTTFAGTGERKNDDGSLSSMSFISPESIDVAQDGTIYVADAGVIRKIKDGKSETIEISPSYYTANKVRCYKNDVYVMTDEFQDSNGERQYGILKLSGEIAQGLFVSNSTYTKITDFCVTGDGNLYFLLYNAGVNMNYLNRISLSTLKITALTELDVGVTSITGDDNGNFYLGNAVKGSIYRYNTGDGKLRLFAGVDNKTKFVDGTNPFFYEPRKLKYADGSLYVLDYNVIRRITINSSKIAVSCESIAGKITPEPFPQTLNGEASETMIAPSNLMDFAVTGGRIILTDPKYAVLREIR